MMIRHHRIAGYTGSGWRLTLLVLAGLWLLSGSLIAQDEPQNPPEPEQEQSALEISAELEQRLAGLEQLQSELGLFDAALIETYEELADFYTEQGEHAEALAMHREAMQLARMNLGLNSEQQLPFIEGIIDASLKLKDWQNADDMHHLQFYLKERLYDPGELRYAEAVEEMGNWKLRILTENLMGHSYRTLSREAEELSRIYRQGIAKIQESPDYRAVNLLPLFEGKSRVDMEVARYLADTPYQYFEGTVSRYIYDRVCTNVRTENGQVVQQCTTVQRENPRYRDSQRDNKRIQVDRALREVEYSMRQMDTILATETDVSLAERQYLETELREMEVEFDRIARTARRRALF